MDGLSLDIKQEQIEKLKVLFPEVVSEDKIDWERLRATLGEDTFISNERYVLNWAGKSDAFKTLQTGTTATLAPAREESINFDSTDNVFIEGENLEVLKVLQKAYFGKIKCIIIDPPYNTGNDSFIYPDKFSETKEEYMRRVGDKDEEGYLMKEGLFRKNSKENGQYHSNWLSMMYPRLFLARNLLRDDGVIFVHIDDNEVHNLRLLMNEIFGEENFVVQITIENDSRTRQYQSIAVTHEYLLGYSKNTNYKFNILSEKDKKFQYSDSESGFDIYELRNRNITFNVNNRANLYYPFWVNPNSRDKDGFYNISLEEIEGWIITYPQESQGIKTVWRWGKEKSLQNLNTNLVAKKHSQGFFQIVKKYRGDSFVYNSVWTENEIKTDIGTLEIKSIFNNKKLFDFPKPKSVSKKLLNIFSDSDDIILDFFAGSGTTAHAVLKLNKEDGGNRKFILLQLPEKTDENSEAYKAGYKTIADICKERIRRVIKKIEEERKPSNQPKLIEDELPELDLGFKVLKLKPSNFKLWQPKIEKAEDLQTAIDEFIDPVKPEAEEENMLFELLLKSGYDFNSKIEVKTIENSKYYHINTNELVLQLSGSPAVTIKDILSILPKKVIMLDRLFENNDQLKTNTFLQFKDAGVDFRTV